MNIPTGSNSISALGIFDYVLFGDFWAFLTYPKDAGVGILRYAAAHQSDGFLDILEVRGNDKRPI
jgi:hypothetical protein